ncbi:uncharacterized protein sS8_0141 [Methylocaldum marinum]|uniref:Uncharacterized protein n=1 Tax=Methylocaldum marinum TaxID=1432792 RepID=A0A286P387_9GAMM|nr:uncharacterized protein sS8_0141 [Methylocaldum marinum]
MQDGFIKVIGRRPVYPVPKGWNEPSETHRQDASGNACECRKDRTPGQRVIPTQPSRMDRE